MTLWSNLWRELIFRRGTAPDATYAFNALSCSWFTAHSCAAADGSYTPEFQLPGKRFPRNCRRTSDHGAALLRGRPQRTEGDSVLA